MKVTRWYDAEWKDKMEVYERYCANNDEMDFEEFNEFFKNYAFNYVASMF